MTLNKDRCAEGADEERPNMTGPTTFHIEDMTCGHCEKTVAGALAQALPGNAVTIDLAARTVIVEGDATLAEAAIREAGYTPMRRA